MIKIIHMKNGTYSANPENITQLQFLYDHLMQRFDKANEYFDNSIIAAEEKELHIPAFEKLLKQLSFVMNLLKINL